MADENTKPLQGSDPATRGALPARNSPRICAIGASAGGIKALATWFEAIPTDLGVAYVVILHLAPDHISELAAVLQLHTTMPIVQVRGKLPLEPDHVYVVPPDRRLALTDGIIEAVPFDGLHERRAPIDQFFQCIAALYHDGTGIILSGAGADGAVGIKALKEAGGLVLVQDPADADFASMPRTAIATGVVDVVSPIPDLAERFAKIVRSPSWLAGPAMGQETESGEALQSILSLVRVRTGHDFSQYKRTTLMRRIARRMQLTHCESIQDYHRHLQVNAGEAQNLLADILISVTSFFRDPAAFAALSSQIIPALFDGGDPKVPIRIWVPACATGEEAYSIAILLLEQAARCEFRPIIQIFATDIDASALATAREGRYPTSIEGDVSEERLHRFFGREGASYVVQKELRELIVFASHNVLRDPPFTRLDLISCRNLLIYFERPLQTQVCETFHYALKPSRYLFLGTAESADGGLELFTTVDKDNHIFQSKLRAGVRIPSTSHLTVEPQTAGLPARRRRTSYPSSSSPGELHRMALEESAPPSVVVDQEHRIVHFSETAGRYILPTAGPVSTDLKVIARPELRFEIQKVLTRAFSKNEPSFSLPVAVAFNGTVRRIAVQAVPLRKSDQAPHAIVYFLDAGEAEARPEVKEGEATAGAVATIRQLETELQLNREQLRSTIEDYEATNEELRAANEELQSTNEEYRSTAEELETSKEELQSLNEELQTLNAELKLNLKRVTQAHDDLENIITSSTVATLFLDLSLRIRLFTPAVAELFNVAASDIGRPITDFTHHLDYEGLIKDAKKVLKDLGPIENEVVAQGRSFLLRIQPYRTRDNRIEGVVATFIDVTKDRETQGRLRQQAALIDLSPDAIIMRALDGTIRSWSSGAEALYRYSKAEAMGQLTHQLLRTRFPIQLSEILTQLRQSGKWQGEVTHTTRDGRQVIVMSRWQIERNSDNGEEFVLESNIDITDRKAAEQRLAEVNKDLERRVAERTRELGQQMKQREEAQAALAQSQRMESIGQLAGGIAHDVNNLLMVISGNLESAGRASADDKVHSFVKNAMDAVDMGASLTRRLLSLGRRHKATPERLNLNDRVSSIEPLLQRSLGEQITISVWLAKDLGLTLADPVEIDNALLNLALNARDAMPKGGNLSIETSKAEIDAAAAAREPNAKPGDYVVLTVTDTGHGMPPDVLRRAIEPFFTTKEAGKGTGLGLSTVFAMAQSSGGFMVIDSEVGKGTSVRIFLPEAAPGAPADRSRQAEEEVPMGDGEVILVVEDNDAVRKVTLERLEALGYVVIAASTGREAIEILKAGEAVDLVFSDIVMPGGVSGFDVAEWVLSSRPGLRVVLTTGHGEMPASASEAVRQVRVLAKPHTRSQLAETIRDALNVPSI